MDNNTEIQERLHRVKSALVNIRALGTSEEGQIQAFVWNLE